MKTAGEEGWATGTAIPVRYVYDGVVRFAEPLTVVEDSPERLIVYGQVGARVYWSDFDFETGDFGTPQPRLWHTRNVLKIFERESWAGIWCWWFADGWTHDGRYVDFQRPIERGAGGLILKDLQLDIVVAPNLSWRMKDEDHFAKAQALGWTSAEEAAQVRTEAERMTRRIAARDVPFSEDWPRWRPDPAWSVPALPSDWQSI